MLAENEIFAQEETPHLLKRDPKKTLADRTSRSQYGLAGDVGNWLN
jgi:hypothetical protein